jgi:hypothetical protein
MRIRVAILAVLALPAGPAGTFAQSEPFRVLNATGVTATGLNVVRSGEGAPWGVDLLNGRTMAPGAAFAMRAPEGIGCVFDIRLTLRDGREVERRDVDICRERTIAVTMQPAPPQR